MKTRKFLPVLFLFFLTGYVFWGCSGGSDSKEPGIDIEVASSFTELQELKLSDYFNKIRFVTLESPDEGLIGSAPLWKLTDQHLIVSTSQKQCLVFERETGRFIASVGHVGNDPEGYSNAYALPDPTTGELLFFGWNGELVHYNLSGKYLKTSKFTPLPDTESERPSIIFPVNKDTIAGYFQDMFINSNYQLAFYDRKGTPLVSYPKEEEPVSFELQSVSILKSLYGKWKDPHVSMMELFDIQGLLILDGMEEKSRKHFLMGWTPFWRHKDQVYFKEQFNDTIYRVQNASLVPHQVFRLDDYFVAPEERYEEGNDKIHIFRILEGENILLFRFAVNPYGFSERKDYNGVYDKRSGEVKINRIDKGFKDDIYNLFSLNPVAVSPSGTFVSILPAEHVYNWIEKHGAESLPRELSHLANIQEDDNPVIVLME